MGSGSLFWFSLPFKKQLLISTTAPLAAALTGARVLVVDDNTTSAQFLITLLNDWKMVGEHAVSGAIALQKLRKATEEGNPYHLAIIDLGMPEMNGLALSHAIKADLHLNATPLVMLTIRGRAFTETQLREAGIAQCHFKPVRQSVLLDCVTTVLANRPTRTGALAPVSAVPQRQERILLAEDMCVNQKVALSQLRKLGYSADVVGNGAEALKALQKTHYDIVLMDCQMPEMDGYEATQALRKEEGARKHTWIIAMTANAMKGDREQCLAAGMDDYVSKPVRIDSLAAALDRAQIFPADATGENAPLYPIIAFPQQYQIR
jgi:CheY-like chemotaxis protein